MGLRTPEQYKASRKDGREVYYREELVKDITTHPIIGVAVEHACIDYRMAEAFYNFAIAFILSIAFIYIVLAAQFESFIHPITIMVSMFLSIPFDLVSLLAAGQTLNIYSVMGLFLLMGVVKKNAILQVDFTNVLRARGKPRYEAQLEADRARLRPILMTTLAIIAGMLPVALGKGGGAASRASLATAVVGGQTLCLLITLLVTPVIYSYFDDLRGLRVVSRLYEIRLWAWLRAKPASGLSPHPDPLPREERGLNHNLLSPVGERIKVRGQRGGSG